MKTVFSVILIALFAGQAAYLPLMAIWLESQRDIIARNLCVNRSRPEKMCHGSCHINKVVAQAAEDGPSDKLPPSPTQKETIYLSVFLPGSIAFPAVPSRHFSPQPYYRPVAVSTFFNHGIFRPPEVA